jgi:hypothetical protein
VLRVGLGPAWVKKDSQGAGCCPSPRNGGAAAKARPRAGTPRKQRARPRRRPLSAAVPAPSSLHPRPRAACPGRGGGRTLGSVVWPPSATRKLNLQWPWRLGQDFLGGPGSTNVTELPARAGGRGPGQGARRAAVGHGPGSQTGAAVWRAQASPQRWLYCAGGGLPLSPPPRTLCPLRARAGRPCRLPPTVVGQVGKAGHQLRHALLRPSRHDDVARLSWKR